MFSLKCVVNNASVVIYQTYQLQLRVFFCAIPKKLSSLIVLDRIVNQSKSFANKQQQTMQTVLSEKCQTAADLQKTYQMHRSTLFATFVSECVNYYFILVNANGTKNKYSKLAHLCMAIRQRSPSTINYLLRS